MEIYQKKIPNGHKTLDFSLYDFKFFIESRCNDSLMPLQMNPYFQRGHVWTEEQQIAYIEELLRGGVEHARTIYINEPNAFKKNAKYQQSVCVDGLQRTTAILKFVNNELKVFGNYFKDFDDYEYYRRDYINLGIKVNINNLATEKEVLEWYLQINSLGTPHSKEEILMVKEMINNLESE